LGHGRRSREAYEQIRPEEKRNMLRLRAVRHGSQRMEHEQKAKVPLRVEIGGGVAAGVSQARTKGY